MLNKWDKRMHFLLYFWCLSSALTLPVHALGQVHALGCIKISAQRACIILSQFTRKVNTQLIIYNAHLIYSVWHHLWWSSLCKIVYCILFWKCKKNVKWNDPDNILNGYDFPLRPYEVQGFWLLLTCVSFTCVGPHLFQWVKRSSADVKVTFVVIMSITIATIHCGVTIKKELQYLRLSWFVYALMMLQWQWEDRVCIQV